MRLTGNLRANPMPAIQSSKKCKKKN